MPLPVRYHLILDVASETLLERVNYYTRLEANCLTLGRARRSCVSVTGAIGVHLLPADSLERKLLGGSVADLPFSSRIAEGHVG